jgi:hypothetical protein
MEPAPTLARSFWHAIEPIHSAVYFAPEPAEAARQIGLRGYWMSYFAGRVAPMGPVPPAPVTAMCFGFAPKMIERAIPDAWKFSDPATILDTRIEAVAVALRTHLDDDAVTRLAELNELLWDAIGACRFDARPLAAAWASVTKTGDPVADAWLATTVLREHRGDGHVFAAVTQGLRGLDASLTHVATGAISREMAQPTRGWTDEDWQKSERRLQARGLLDRDGRLTKTGGALRRDLEETTDRLAAAPVERLGELGVKQAIELAAPVSRQLIDNGTVPIPNPVGAPRP